MEKLSNFFSFVSNLEKNKEKNLNCGKSKCTQG